jgi:Chromo (CHRromatin Organisation MOdifier) domain
VIVAPQPPGAGKTMLAPRGVVAGHGTMVPLAGTSTGLAKQQELIKAQQRQNLTPTQLLHQQQLMVQQQQVFAQQQLHLRQQQLLQQQRLTAKQQAAYQKQVSQARLAAHAKTVAKARKEETQRVARMPVQPVVQDVLPPAFVPDALRSASPPPRKRLRKGLVGPVTMASGSLHAAANAIFSPVDLQLLLTTPSVATLRPAASPVGAPVPMRSSPGLPQPRRLAPSPSPMSSPSPGRASSSMADTPEPLRCPQAASPTAATPSTAGVHRIVFSRRAPPRTLAAVTEKVLVIERLVARRENEDAGGVIEYYVKWHNVGWDRCSWESRAALLQDVPGLVLEFDGRHPSAPSVVRDIPRVAAIGERDDLESRIADIKARKSKKEAAEREKARLEAEPILIPAWVEQPLVELSFAGMVMHIRRDETTLYNDPMAAGRDMKRRRLRFKAEYPEEARRMFVPSKTETATKERTDAKALIDAAVKKYKEHGSRPIQFPRALGSVLAVDLPHPVSRADIDCSPPSWEWYLQSLGLECVDWSRSNPPHMPTASEAVRRSAQHAIAAADGTARELQRERELRVAHERVDIETGATPVRRATATAAGELRKVADGAYDEGIELAQGGPALLLSDAVVTARLDATVRGVVAGSIVPAEVANTGLVRKGLGGETVAGGEGKKRLLRERNKVFAAGLSAARSRDAVNAEPTETASVTTGAGASVAGGTRVYDPVWCCWRTLPATAKGE